MIKNLPLISYHGGHSGELCAHASDTKEQILNSYLEKNFNYAAMIEHLPCREERFLYDDEKSQGLTAKKLQDRFLNYVNFDITRLKNIIPEDRCFLFGIESEFYGKNPLYDLELEIRKYKAEILVASVHHVNNIPFDVSKDFYSQAMKQFTSIDDLYEAYYAQQSELIDLCIDLRKDMPIVIGHFDLISLFTPNHIPSSSVKKLMLRNIHKAIYNDLVFEINARGFKKIDRPFPDISLISLLIDSNAKLTLGDDSHAANEVGMNYDKLALYLVEQDFNCTAFVRENEKINEIAIPITSYEI